MAISVHAQGMYASVYAKFWTTEGYVTLLNTQQVGVILVLSLHSFDNNLYNLWICI